MAYLIQQTATAVAMIVDSVNGTTPTDLQHLCDLLKSEKA